jgi:hypothetical protein
MGTHAVVHFVSVGVQRKSRLVSYYFQYDGYLTGVGKQLLNFLKSRTIVNGIPMGHRNDRTIANGFDCLAAQFCCEFKEGPGGLYIYNVDIYGSEHFTYTVYFHEKTKELAIQFEPTNQTYSLKEFEEFILLNEEEA